MNSFSNILPLDIGDVQLILHGFLMGFHCFSVQFPFKIHWISMVSPLDQGP